MPIDTIYGGRFARPTGHPDTLCYFHSTSGHDSGTASSPKGWYDAGDFGKYVVNAGVTLGNMFFFYENFGGYFGDSAMNIPESHNGVDDFLDEVKYELDWLLTMQDSDGGVFHKLTTLRHAGMVMPHKDVEKRYFIGKSTSAALNFAAVMAMASRVYKKVSGFEAFADTCLSRAKWAWTWSVTHPNQYFTANPSGVNTGTYDDDILTDDEFLWAASELYITTGEQAYKDSLQIEDLYYSFPASWKEPGRLTPLSLATVPSVLDSQSLATVRLEVKAMADTYLKQIAGHAFRIPSANYYFWGSNGVFANAGLFLLAAYKITNDTAYARGAAEIADYLLGKNAPNISFVSGFGIYRAEHPHHRQSMADSIADPIPGFLMGGPNGSPSEYSDDAGAYDKNEVAINWNGPMTGLFAALNQIFGVNTVSAAKTEYFVVPSIKGQGTVIVEPAKMTYAIGDTVKFTAVPREKQMFFGWFGMGGILSTDSVYTLIVSRDMKVAALFGDAEELVKNGDFSKAVGSEWSRPSGATRTIDSDGVCKLTITNPGTEDWSVQFVQTGLPLYTGKRYVFQFDARTDGERTIIADVAKNGGDYGSYMVTKSCNLTSTMKHFKYIFNMRKASDLNSRITFNCGLDSLPVYIDNVSLKLYDSTTAPVLFQVAMGSVEQHFAFRQINGKMQYTLAIVDPSKAKLEIFDLNGKVRGSLTSQIRSSGKGTCSMIMDNRLACGFYLIRYFDGEKLYLHSWSNVVK
jgi:endoglucanase